MHPTQQPEPNTLHAPNPTARAQQGLLQLPLLLRILPTSNSKYAKFKVEVDRNSGPTYKVVGIKQTGEYYFQLANSAVAA